MDQMEDVQMSPQSASAAAPSGQYHCRQPTQQPPTASTYTPHTRNEQHYDPVHEANQYYQSPNGNPSNRPTYQLPQQVPHWQSGSYLPFSHWNSNYSEGPRPNFSGSEASPFTGVRGLMDLPWGDVRTYEPFSGYGYYSRPPGNASSSDSAAGPNHHQLTVPGMPSQIRAYGNHSVHPDIWQQHSPHRILPPPTPNQPRRAPRTEEPNAERLAAHHHHQHNHHQASPPSENYRQSSTARRSHRSRGAAIPEHWNVGNRPHSLAGMGQDAFSDEDDDEGFPGGEYRRRQIMLGLGDEERALAAVRGALALGKKVTTRDFLVNLEVVPIDQIPDGERNCTICYETMGTENPEGLTEKAVRMPKCKHIFGDICIKKWCQDSDTCPYCRDKLPSELSVKRSLASLDYNRSLMARERMRLIERARRAAAAANGHGVVRNPEVNHLDDENPRPRDGVESYVPVGDPWLPLTGPSRNPGADNGDRPSERRRPGRGRLGVNRPAHSLGRPTSVGSSRLFAAQTTAQRAQATMPASGLTFGDHVPNDRAVTPPPPPPALTRQNSNPDSVSSPWDSISALPAEEASPPVAVGSGVSPARDAQLEHPFHYRIDPYMAYRHDEGSNITSPTSRNPPSLANSTLASPFQGVTSPLRQHPTSEGTNAQRQQDLGTDPLFAPW